MTEEQHEPEVEATPDDFEGWQPDKLPPPEKPYEIRQTVPERIKQKPVVRALIAAAVLASSAGAYAMYKKPAQQTESRLQLQAANKRARLPEAVSGGDDKVHVNAVRPPSDEVDPGWLNQRAKDPRAPMACEDLEDPQAAVRCEEAKARLESKYPWAREVPPQNVRGYEPTAYAANPNREQQDESKVEEEPLKTLGILGDEKKRDEQVGQAVSQPSTPFAVPSVGLSAKQAHQMAEAMAGGAQDDPEASKERFMAQGGIETLTGGEEDIGECDLSAGTAVHGSVMVAINSDLPAQNTVTIKVNKTVMCGANDEHIAIPQGSSFVGSVDQRVVYGQERMMLCMKQLNRPKSAAHPRGDRKQLGCFAVADITGASGMVSDVDNHWGAVIGGSLLSAILSLGTTSLGGDQAGFAPTLAQNAARNAGNNLNQAGQKIVQRDLARKPTLTTEQLDDVVIQFSSNLPLTPWEPVGVKRGRRVAAW